MCRGWLVIVVDLAGDVGDLPGGMGTLTYVRISDRTVADEYFTSPVTSRHLACSERLADVPRPGRAHAPADRHARPADSAAGHSGWPEVGTSVALNGLADAGRCPAGHHQPRRGFRVITGKPAGTRPGRPSNGTRAGGPTSRARARTPALRPGPCPRGGPPQRRRT